MTDPTVPVVLATTTTTTTTTCELDETIVNDVTISSLRDIGLSFFAPLCGRNRGAFVLQPSDQQTYGCTKFPDNYYQLATSSIENNNNISVSDANSIPHLYQNGNITSMETIQLLNYFVSTIYESSSHVEDDLYACDTGGLSKLKCPGIKQLTNPTSSSLVTPIRSVTIAGLFTSVPFIGGEGTASLEAMRAFYTIHDFIEMKQNGLNTVHIPFPVSYFDPATLDHKIVADEVLQHLTTVLGMIKKVGLQVIIELDDDKDDAVATDAAVIAATEYVRDYLKTKNPSTFVGLQLPTKTFYTIARSVDTNVPLFVPYNQGDLKNINIQSSTTTDSNWYVALKLDHRTDIADIASSSSLDDRMKMYYQEAKACIYRAPLEYTYCYKRVPVYVYSGFDVAIDNCIDQQNNNFIDYGQCEHFDETIDSNWWYEHRQSFIKRQLFSYEKGLGWSYRAWKLYNETSTTSTSSSNRLDTPAKLLALKNVMAAGLFPSLDGSFSTTYNDTDISSSITFACLNGPVNDFILGDDTVSPTSSPPPDCGYGWWNVTIQNCSYWIPPNPPPPSDPPTHWPLPSPVLCPEIPLPMDMDMMGNNTELFMTTVASGASQQQMFTLHDVLRAGGIGAFMTFFVCYVMYNIYKQSQQQQRLNAGYNPI